MDFFMLSVATTSYGWSRCSVFVWPRLNSANQLYLLSQWSRIWIKLVKPCFKCIVYEMTSSVTKITVTCELMIGLSCFHCSLILRELHFWHDLRYGFLLTLLIPWGTLVKKWAKRRENSIFTKMTLDDSEDVSYTVTLVLKVFTIMIIDMRFQVFTAETQIDLKSSFSKLVLPKKHLKAF